MTARVGGTVYDRTEGPCRYGTAGDRGRNNESAVGKTGGAALSVRRPRGTAQRTGRPGTLARSLAVAVLTALGETRRSGPRHGEARRGCAADNDLQRRAYRCSSGRVVRQWRPYGAGGVSATPTRARPARRQRLDTSRADERPTQAPPGHSNSDQAATLVGAAAPALCIQLDRRGKMMRSPKGRCSRHDQSHSAAEGPDTIPLGFVELLTRRLCCLWLTDSRHGGALVTHDRGQAGIPDRRWNRLGQDDSAVKT